MSLNLRAFLSDEHFQGQKNVHELGVGGLTRTLRNVLQRAASRAVKALGLANLTDNSTGVAGIVFTADNTTNRLTAAEGPDYKTADLIGKLAGADLPNGLLTTVDYYAIRVSSTVFQVALSAQAAREGTAVTFSDNGTGTHTIVALKPVAVPAEADVSGGTTGCTAASVNTSMDTVADAQATLAGRVNALLALCAQAGSIDDGQGTDGAGTIAAIDVDVAANTNDTDSVAYAGLRTVFDELLANQKALLLVVNKLRRAVGLADADVSPAGSNQGSQPRGFDLTATLTNTVSSADAVSSATEAAVEAALQDLADNVAFLADRVDEVSSIAGAAAGNIEVSAFIDATAYAAGTDVNVVSPVSGRIRGMRTLVSVATTGAGDVTAELGGVAVANLTVTVANGAAVGEVDEDLAVADSASNLVEQGETIAIQSDGVPSAGAVLVTLLIAPTEEGELLLDVFAG